jgi:epoxyqueuosine reductase
LLVDVPADDHGGVSAAPPAVDPAPIVQLGLDAGLDAVGVADVEPFGDARVEIERRRDAGLHGGMAFTFRTPARSTDPRVTMAHAQALVVGALRYDRTPMPERPPEAAGRVARYSWLDHYAILRAALTEIADHLRANGWAAIVLADDNALVDRAAAHRAGLGWFGKNANLLLPGQGSWCVLGSVLTDAPITPNADPQPDGCGSCTRCVDACPTNAIVAPGVVDARRCLAWLVQAPGAFPHEHREALGDRIYGCDDCQEVCPPNRRQSRILDAPAAVPSDAEAWVPLLELLDASDDQLLARHGRWYIPQRQPAYLRRNALLALANTADPADPQVVDAIRAALADPDPIVRSHAVWAAVGLPPRLRRPDGGGRACGEPSHGPDTSVKHLLVTNDFPPKLGGIQSYLWELWRRLPPDSFSVLTTPYDGALEWDAEQPYRVVRTRERVLLPAPDLRRRIDALADECGAELVVLDPGLPLGAIGPSLSRPYAVVVHGAEVTTYGRIPGSRSMLGRVLRGAELVVAAGGYPLAEAERAARRALPGVVVPPGVDVERFVPLDERSRHAARHELGLPVDATVVLCLSRLVPRKGFDVVIEAAAALAPRHPSLVVAVAGGGRDRSRLERIARRSGAPVRFLGRVPDHLTPRLYASSDMFAMLCRNRWLGLEQEGFGIVFLEAAAAGTPQIAGQSGGSHEAVVHGETGLVVRSPADPTAVAAAIDVLLDDPDRRRDMGRRARDRVVAELTYDLLAERLAEALQVDR